VPQPSNSYYYPGGSIGGPVLIPGTGFNKSREKLFFGTGFEYFHQTLDTGLLRAIVPTPADVGGDSDAIVKISNASVGLLGVPDKITRSP
jgi:hypothetical protein